MKKQCCMSNQRHRFNFIKGTCLGVWTAASSQYVSASRRWALLAGKSFRKPSVHFHSCFQQCEWCDSLLGQRDYWDQASPSSMPLAQPAKPAQSVPPAPPVPYRAAHQAHREQRGTRDPSNCPCFGRLSGKPAWRGPPVPRLSHCSPLSPRSEILRTIYLLWGVAFLRPSYGTAGNCEFLCFQHGQCEFYSRVIF